MPKLDNESQEMLDVAREILAHTREGMVMVIDTDGYNGAAGHNVSVHTIIGQLEQLKHQILTKEEQRVRDIAYRNEEAPRG